MPASVMGERPDGPGVVVVIQWGPEVRLFSHSGLLTALMQEGWQVTVAAKIADADLRQQLPEGVALFPMLPERPTRVRERVGAVLDRAQRDRYGEVAAGRGVQPGRRGAARLGQGVVAMAARWECLYMALLAVERSMRRLRPGHEWRRLLVRSRARAVLVSDLRGYTIDGLLAAAATLRVPSVALVNSWKDINARMRLRTEHNAIGVWHECMRSEAVRLQPWLDPCRLHVVGCAHFAPLTRSEYVLPRGELLRRLALPAAARFLLFTGANPSRIPGDEQYVRLLIEAIETGTLPDDLFVVVRPNPQDTEGVLRKAALKLGGRVRVAVPDWQWNPKRDWNYARRADLVAYASLLTHAEMNVSVASTVTVECAITDLPVVNPLFHAPGAATGCSSAGEEWLGGFYRPARQTAAAIGVQNERELIQAAARFVGSREYGRENRERFVKEQLGVSPGRAVGAAVELICRTGLDRPARGCGHELSTEPDREPGAALRLPVATE